jgi:hypothetical protein
MNTRLLLGAVLCLTFASCALKHPPFGADIMPESARAKIPGSWASLDNVRLLRMESFYAVLAAEHRWDTNQTAVMLKDEDARSFSFADDFFAWREWRIDSKRLQYRRRFVVSFGSCSFDEPRDDLRVLKLL